MSARRLRVGIDVHTVGLRHTGNETYIRNIVERLARIETDGVEFHYYHTLPSREFEHGEWKGRLHRLWPHQPMVRIPVSFPLALARDLIDVAHFQYVKPPLCPCPAVVIIHDVCFEAFRDAFAPLERLRMQTLVPRSARAAARVLTCSEFSKSEIVARYGIPADRVSVIYDGVSARFRPAADAGSLQRVAERLALPRAFILGVGNLQPRKNLERLVRAFARLRGRGIGHELVLVGQQRWGGEQVRAAIERAGVSGRVRMTGYVDDADLVALYNLADLFVYPSLYEGFGLPVIEAMACGTPVVASNSTSIPEVAGNAALLVDPLDEEALAHAMCRAITDRNLHAALRRRGLRRSARFSWDATARKTLEAYRSAASGPPKAALQKEIA